MSFLKNISKGLLNLRVLVKILLNNDTNVEDNTVTGVIFSMDRPIQLFALLESYYKYCSDPAPLIILYKTSNTAFLKGYKEIELYFNEYQTSFIQESSFRENLISILTNILSKYLFFLVDDNIFKTPFIFSDFLNLPDNNKYILSLRLGENLNYCYTGAVQQSLPKFKNAKKFLAWDWRKGESDWNYVFSVDGNVYNTREVLEMSKQISYKAPNSYEANMNVFRFLLRRKKGLCYPNSVLINVCLNRVQDEIENISGDISPKQLLEYWEEKEKINISYFHEIDNKSAHIEVKKLSLINR